ncbi:FAD-dependent monooxygenase [Albibacterium indicum]|uniref:FAD-dependent monooxygenase n=1 Tax=Albibacterium indicum TaxID=2292082 RepID=UPI000E4BCCAA|nr:FAD-dependent monooxygenase [Pedobacter indicus]
MKFTNKNVDLIIVGVNSATLLLASQLVKYGIRPTIIDARKGLSSNSSVITLDRISLDILSRLGFGQVPLESGSECEGLTVQSDGQVLRYFDFSNNLHLSAQNSFVNLEQEKIDKVLLSYLGSQVCPVYWDSKVTAIQQDNNGVNVMIQQAGQPHGVRAEWVVSSDRSDASIYGSLEADYKRWIFKRPIFVSEIEPDEQVDKDQHLVLMKRGFMFAEPSERINRYKLLSTSKGETAIEVKASASIAGAYMRERCIFLGETNFDSFSLFRSSVNIHFQDVCNLSWKLALALLGKIDKSILTSYELERRPVAMRSFKRNYWLMKILLYKGKILSKVRQKFLLKSLDQLLNSKDHYRASSLSLHHSLSENIVSGDRLPNLTIYDERKGNETSLHEWIEKPGFVLLLIGSLSSHLRFKIGQWVKQKYATYMHIYYLPFSDKNKHVFEAFEINPEQHRMVLIRPDGYIAFINDVLNATLVDTYMEGILKWRY